MGIDQRILFSSKYLLSLFKGIHVAHILINPRLQSVARLLLFPRVVDVRKGRLDVPLPHRR